MRFSDYPLLNTPSMILVVLQTAADGPTTETACVARLQALLAEADEHPPFGASDIARRLSVIVRYLGEARLIAPAGPGRIVITGRGRAALAEHPDGFDTADLMVFPEFASYLGGLDQPRPHLDVREGSYDAGFEAYWVGRLPADNPHPEDSIDHQAWANGWSEALDEDFGEDFRLDGPRRPSR